MKEKVRTIVDIYNDVLKEYEILVTLDPARDDFWLQRLKLKILMDTAVEAVSKGNPLDGILHNDIIGKLTALRVKIA